MCGVVVVVVAPDQQAKRRTKARAKLSSNPLLPRRSLHFAAAQTIQSLRGRREVKAKVGVEPTHQTNGGHFSKVLGIPMPSPPRDKYQ